MMASTNVDSPDLQPYDRGKSPSTTRRAIMCLNGDPHALKATHCLCNSRLVVDQDDLEWVTILSNVSYIV